MFAAPGLKYMEVPNLTNGTEYTFTVKTMDISGNKSEGVTVKATPLAVDSKETMKLQTSLSINAIKLFSFEMKKHLDYGNLRECFFQAVSNSSWANEGYLVCLRLNNEPEFKNEIQRLSNAFGIGIIQLNEENINDSEIICPARYNENIDWDTLDRLAEDSPDFRKFISDLTEDIALGKVKSKYDKIKKLFNRNIFSASQAC